MDRIEQLIDELHLEDLRNELHPSMFDENEGYDMLIVRIPLIGEKLQILSMGFILTPEASYFYNKETKQFEPLSDRFEGPHKKLDKMTDRLLRSFQHYQELIADMEEMLYENRTSEDFMTDWMALKRDILRIERVLLRTSEVMKEVYEHYETVESFPVNHYVDLYEHTDRIMRSATLQLSKLDYLYNFYSARTNEKMNKMIYLLTIISAVFLPLNLVVGFFGMNTSGLPFAGGEKGTLSAVMLMIFLMVLTSGIVYFWKHRYER